MDPSSGLQPERQPSAFNHELIEKEIVHLKKKSSTRNRDERARYTSRSLMVLAILALGWFYAMDPFLHSYYRGDAIRDYLYLHNYGSDAQAVALVKTGILSNYEAQVLGKRQGSFQDYYSTPADADKKAAEIIGYMNGVRNLHDGNYAALSLVNKVRYVVFIETGLSTPTDWEFLNPSIGQ
jgi:hypothetical protein